METDTKRLFVAVRPPESLLAQLHKSQRELQFRLTTSAVKNPGRIRWTSADQMHITIVFAIAFPTHRIDVLSEALAANASRTPSFQIRFDHFNTRPAFSRPKLIWSPVRDGVVPLQQLRASVLADFERVQPGSTSIEKRKYEPHLTVGRVSKGVSFTFARTIRKTVKAESSPVTPWPAGELELIESVLEIGGATHTVLERFPLAETS